MKLLMALAVLLGPALPDVRVVAWWGVERLDRAHRPGTGRELRRSPVDRGLGLALSWRCCIGDSPVPGAFGYVLEASAFEGRDAAIDGPTDEMAWSSDAAQWAPSAPVTSGPDPSGCGPDVLEPNERTPPRLEPERTGRPVCVDPCPRHSAMELIDADEARALTALQTVERRR